MMNQPARTARNDEGGALVMSLLLVIALSIVGAGMTVLTLSETYGSMNYRLMTQARYGAESAVHRAANYLLNNYALPGGPGDPMAAYTVTTEPVQANGGPVVLSAMTGVASNYPAADTQAAFQAATTGNLVVGNANVQYTASARLLSMRQVEVYGVAAPQVIQTWEITGRGVTTGARNAQVEVTTTLERQATPLFNYAVFATNSGCGSLNFSGGAEVDSYDSQSFTMNAGNVVTQQYGGNIGSNGNLNESGGADIYGTMSTPRTGVGNCSAGGMTAWTVNGGATVTGGLIQLPQALNFPTPSPPNPMPPTDTLQINTSFNCGAQPGCSVVGTANFALAPGSYGNINMSGGSIVHLSAGVYTVNRLSMSGGSTLVIDSGPVIFNVAGQGTTSPVDMAGGVLTNGSYNPAHFQIQYAGTHQIQLAGGTTAAGMVYAPNSPVQISGGVHWYGAIVASTFNASGGMKVHNDRQLANQFMSVGNFMLGSFSWKKF